MVAITLRMLFMLQKHWTGKLKAIVVFALRLPSVLSCPPSSRTRNLTISSHFPMYSIIPIAIYRLLSLQSLRSTSNPFLDRITLTAWTQGEMVYSLVTAVIPTLMPFLVKMNTGLGAFSRDDFIQQTTVQESFSGGGGNSYAMQSLKTSQGGSRVRSRDRNKMERYSKRGRRNPLANHHSLFLQMRPDHVHFQSMVVSQKDPKPTQRRSMSSDDSQKVMVRKSVDVTYSKEEEERR